MDAARTVHTLEVVPDKTAIRRTFKKNAKAICAQLDHLDTDELLRIQCELDSNAASVTVGEFTLNRAMVTIVSTSKTVHVEDIIPNVVHVSFGIDRIMKAVFETSRQENK